MRKSKSKSKSKCSTIRLKRGSDESGAFSHYYRLSQRIGIKVIRAYEAWCFQDPLATVKELKQSLLWKQALEEVRLLRKARKSKVVPRCYRLVPVKVSEGFYPGIVMQHINGELLRDRHTDTPVQEEIKDQLKEQLAQAGLLMGDLHICNVIVDSKEKCWAIDFSPSFVEVVS